MPNTDSRVRKLRPKSRLEKITRKLRSLLGEIRVDDGAQLGPQRPPRLRRRGFELF